MQHTSHTQVIFADSAEEAKEKYLALGIKPDHDPNPQIDVIKATEDEDFDINMDFNLIGEISVGIVNFVKIHSYNNIANKNAHSTVKNPAKPIAIPLMAPCNSPMAMARVVPTAWLQVPIPIPCATGSSRSVLSCSIPAIHRSFLLTVQKKQRKNI